MQKHSHTIAKEGSMNLLVAGSASVPLPVYDVSKMANTGVSSTPKHNDPEGNNNLSSTKTKCTTSNMLANAMGSFAPSAPAQGATAAVAGGSSTSTDRNEEEVSQLLQELQSLTDSPHAQAVLQGALETIETRASCNFDPLFRDIFLESCIRDTLVDLTLKGTEQSLLLALHLIEGLLPIPYTRPQQKFTRLCRSLSAVMQCGLARLLVEAQELFKRMLRLDIQFDDPPLLTFLPKDLKDSCEHALMHLHNRLQQTNTQHLAKCVSILLASAATVEENPRYISAHLRIQLVMLSTTLSSFGDSALCATAYDCLCAIFRSTAHMRRNEIVMENRRVCDESIRALNNSHCNEASVVSALAGLRALLSSRGLSGIDKHIMPQLCILITEQHRITKSSAVRLAVCKLVPIIAPIDLHHASRRSSYCAIIMKPVKNIRDERAKSDELHNVAAFIESVGHAMLDDTNKTNLNSILYRYISRVETQEACWRIIAAICVTNKNDAQWQDHVLKSASLPIDELSVHCPSCGTPSLAQTTLSASLGECTNVDPQSLDTKARGPPHLNAAPSLPLKASTTANEPKKVATSTMTTAEGTSLASQVRACNDEGVSKSVVDSQYGNNVTSLLGTLPTYPATSHIATSSMQNLTGDYHVPINVTSTLSTVEIIRRCVPYIAQAALTQNLVRYLRIIQEDMPFLHSDIESLLNKLVDSTLERFSQSSVDSESSRGAGTDVNIPDSVVPQVESSTNTALHTKHSLLPAVGSIPQFLAVPHTSDNNKKIGGDFIANAMGNATTHNDKQNDALSSVGIDFLRRVTPPCCSSKASVGSHFIPSKSAAQTKLYAAGQPAHFVHPAPRPHSDLTVALESLALRPVTSVQKLEEIKTVIMPFQRNVDPAVRQQSSEAIVLSLSEWTQYAKKHKTSTYSTRVTEIIESYLKNTFLEMNAACRYREITLLANATNLHPFLCNQHTLSVLLSFLNSDSLVREKTVELLVSLTQDPKLSHAVLTVRQSLYVTIESYVLVLEYTNDVRTLIRSLADLQTFTSFSVRLLNSHFFRILYAFQKRLQEDNVTDPVSLAILKTLEKILKALAREEKMILQYQDNFVELYSLVVSILKESSLLVLRHAAINVLVNLNRMCPNFLVFIEDKLYELINILGNVYTANQCTREELLNILMLFGQLGAVNPSSNAVVVNKKKSEEAVVHSEVDSDLTFDCAAIVYRTLCRMLDVSMSEAVYSQTLRTLMEFIRSTQDRKDVVDGVRAVQAVLQVTKRFTDSPSLRLEALHVLAVITVLRHERISRLMLPEIVVLLEQLWVPSDLALFRGVLEVVSALKPGKLSSKEQLESWAWLYPRLVGVALQDHTETHEFRLHVVEIILNMSYIPPHCIPIVFPMLIYFLQKADLPAEVRSQSLCAAIHIVCELRAVQYLPSLMQGLSTMVRHCESNKELAARMSTQGVREFLRMLSALHLSGRAIVKQLRDCIPGTNEHGSSCARAPTLSTLGKHPNSAIGKTPGQPAWVATAGPTNTLAGVAAGRAFLHKHSELLRGDDDDDGDTIPASIALSGANSFQDLELFMKHIECGARLKESKLREWFAELQKWIILVTPHPALHVLVDLFDKHELLRRELFYPSFKTLCEVLNAEQIKKVNDVLTLVLNSNDTDLSSKCLGLVDYLDHNPPKIAKEVLDRLRKLEHTDGGKVFIHATDKRSLRQNANPNWSTWHSGPFSANDERSPHVGSLISTSTINNSKAQDILSGKEDNNSVHGDKNGNQPLFDSDATLFGSQQLEKSISHRNPKDKDDYAQSDEPCAAKSSVTSSNELTRFEGMHKSLTLISQSRCKDPHDNKNYLSCSTHFPQKPQLMAHGVRSPCKTNVLFSVKDVVRAAERTHMYDKAFSYLEDDLQRMLHIYRHREMPCEVIKKTVWPLAWLYSQREMQDSVVGLFQTIRYAGGDEDGFRFELLRWWEKAKQAYQKALPSNLIGSSVSSAAVVGYVRTLCFCAEWDRALEVSKQVCRYSSHSFASVNGSAHRSDIHNGISSTVAQCGALSAWVLGRWDDVTQLAKCISPSEGSNAYISRFLLNVAHLRSVIIDSATDSYDTLRQSFRQAKLVVDDSLRTLMPLSYSHAYENIAMLQHFTELEETLDYSICCFPKRRSQFIERWNMRFLHLKPDSLYPSLRTLLLHSLVLSRNEMSIMMLHFCESMSADYPHLAIWAMNWLWQGTPSSHADPSPSPMRSNDMRKNSPSVVVGYICHLWSQGHRQNAVCYMDQYLTEHGKELEVSDAACYGRAHLKLGTWKQDLHAECFWMKGYREVELGHFHAAIRAVPHSYEAWHSWGLMNYRVQQRDRRLSLEELHRFVEAAHQGFVAAICRCKSPSEALPGVMRLLQLWVIYNGVALLKEMVADSISRIPVDHWVQAIPQLIGYLSNDSHDIREVISMILQSLCEKHPQAVVFPLLVVLIPDDMGNNTDPQLLLKRELVQSVIRHCPKRIRNEAETVARLLVDASAIPIEKIRENLSHIAVAWNPNAEYEDDREEIHRRLNATLDLFQANRKHLLYTVGDIGQFVQMVIDDDLRGQREDAARIVNQLVDEITKHISENLGKEPQKAMEPLLRLRNCFIAVFGEYDIQNVNYPTIVSFSSDLDVIPSKKRPRRIQLNGSDGCLYSYCLKGNEDIRMDERVMQLLRMVNILLSQTRMPSRANIHIFPVIPITSSVGLLGWIKDARTINNTICNYRATISRLRAHHESIVLRNYVESFGQWEKLSIIQRTEALDYVMSQENCEAVDVARTMWHRANTAEQWLDCRTVYTTSLATMSLVGYVLGLGDRHLGNILLSMSTGKIVHIDFGDSFDVGRLRHVLPETVPFRLTRMLTSAMEVFGVNGVFRASATRTQAILSENRDSIMALLSAFVYDPIMQHKGKVKNITEKSRASQNVVERTRNKLRGREMALSNARMTTFNTTSESCRRPDLLFMSKAFDDDAVREESLVMSPEQQVAFLIDEATRIDNYTTLYFGWGPLW